MAAGVTGFPPTLLEKLSPRFLLDTRGWVLAGSGEEHSKIPDYGGDLHDL